MPERATERVAVLMTPTEKAAYARRGNEPRADEEALEAVLTQLELSTPRAERVLGEVLAEVRTALRVQS